MGKFGRDELEEAFQRYWQASCTFCCYQRRRELFRNPLMAAT